jgi:hypothetical protein
MPFPDPFDDDPPAWRERAEAVEYWIVGALLVGAWIYGVVIGLRSLVRLLRV